MLLKDLKTKEEEFLVVDLGGTNMRLGLTKGPSQEKRSVLKLKVADFASPIQALDHYYETQVKDGNKPTSCCIAVAGAVPKTDLVEMTNSLWSFSRRELKKRYGWDRLLVINDFSALAMAIPWFSDQEISSIGVHGQAQKGSPVGVLGPGTGLGVSSLLSYQGEYFPLSAEGGHVSFAPTDERQMEILHLLRRQFDRVSVERLLCGEGLVNLHKVLKVIDGVNEPDATPPEILEKGLSHESELCREVLTSFCGILGNVAGDLALTIGAKGGVYIGGGIVPRMKEFFLTSPFRTNFENKGRLSSFVLTIPTYLIEADIAALRGGAAALLSPHFKE